MRFKYKKKSHRGKFFLNAVIVILGLSLISVGVNYWVYFDIQKRLKIRISGQYIPMVFLPSFEVRRGGFSWEEKVRLLEGDFKVSFDPWSLVSQQGLRIVIASKGSKIQFLGSWALQEGIEEATLDSVTADIVLGRRGLSGINQIEVLSPSFQFSLKNADKKITPKTESH